MYHLALVAAGGEVHLVSFHRPLLSPPFSAVAVNKEALELRIPQR